jgi:hypothetical protein
MLTKLVKKVSEINFLLYFASREEKRREEKRREEKRREEKRFSSLLFSSLLSRLCPRENAFVLLRLRRRDARRELMKKVRTLYKLRF